MLGRQTVQFFLLAFGWSWLVWTPMVWWMKSQGITDVLDAPAWVMLCALLGGYGPTAAGLILSARHGGRAGAMALLSRLKRWRAPISVHLLIWLGPPLFLFIAMMMAPHLAERLGSPVWSRLQLIPLAIVAAVPFGPMGEELGWRGYALPRLQGRTSALTASLVLGVAWCFWHTPLFWAPAGTTISGHEVTIAAVSKYLAYTCGLSILHTWIFNHSNGSALLPVAFHTSTNAVLPLLLFPARDDDASLTLEWLSLIPLWAVALGLVAVFGAARLRRGDLPPACRIET